MEMFQSDRLELRRQRNFGEKINATFFYIRHNFKSILLSLLIIVGPLTLILGIVKMLWPIPNPFTSFLSPGETPFDGEDINTVRIILVQMLAYLTSLINIALAWAVGLAHITLYKEGMRGDISVEDVWRKTRGYFWQVVLAALCVFLAVLPILIFVGFLLTAVFVAVHPLIGGLFMLSLFIVSGMLLIQIVHIQIFEQVNPFTAMGRSIQLSGGSFWDALLYFLMIIYIYSQLNIAFALPTIGVYATEFLWAIEPPRILLQALYSLVESFSSLGQTLGVLMLSIAFSFQYFSLMERKYAVGFMEQIDAWALPEKEDIKEEPA